MKSQDVKLMSGISNQSSMIENRAQNKPIA